MLVWYLDTVGPSLMNVICIIVPIVGFIVGFMRGFYDKSVRIIEGGLIIVATLYLKNPMSSILYKYVPFLDFDYRVFNFILFEFISYVAVAILLVIIVHILNKFINVVERLVGIILHIGVPSNILGALVSLIEYTFFLYVFIFIVFFFSSITNSPIESSVANKIYDNIPVMKQVFGKSFDACIEVGERMASFDSTDNINYDSVKILLDNHFVTKENVEYVINNKKLSFKGSKELLSKYD